MLHICLVGSRYFGASVFEALRQESGVRIQTVVAYDAKDRLSQAAQSAGVPVRYLANPKLVPAEDIPEGTDLIVAAHTHARISDAALARARLGGVGYHPSLLPRHRGIAAVEWTLLEGDPIAGGSVYHLADGWDAGAIAAQDWCFVARDDTARTLWERELAPMGLRLLAQVVCHARDKGALPAHSQDPRYATRAPMLRHAVVRPEDEPPSTTTLVATVVRPDRPGIVRALAERGARFGANWNAGRMQRVAGEFAGMVQFDVAHDKAQDLAAALTGLQSGELKVHVAMSQQPGMGAANSRVLELDLIGEDRPGIVADLARLLADLGISIESLNTQTLSHTGSGSPRFRAQAQLRVPGSLQLDGLKAQLDALTKALLVDIALGEHAPG